MSDFSKELQKITIANAYKQVDEQAELRIQTYKAKEQEIRDRSIGYVNQVKSILKDMASEGLGSIEIFFDNRCMRIGGLIPIEELVYCSDHIIELLKKHKVNITLQGWHYAAWWYGSEKHCQDRCIIISEAGASLVKRS